MKRAHSNEKGVSLVEVMVASGLVMAISLSLATMNYNTRRAARSLALTNDLNSVASNIYQVLASPPRCLDFMTDAVGGNLLPALGGYPIPLPRVRAGGQDLAVVTPVADGIPLRISNIELHRDQTGGANPNLGTYAVGETAFVVTLKIEAERNGDGRQLPGSKTLSREFPIRVVSNAAGTVLNCFRDPGMRDICNAIGFPANQAAMNNGQGMLCDLGPEICRQLGGTYTQGAVPPCQYNQPPLINITERVCIDMGGTYTGGVPACQFGANADTGLTSVTAACASFGGLLRPGPAPAKCDFCVNSGGEWNPARNAGAGGCDFDRKPCEARGTVAQPTVYDPATGDCSNTTAAECDRLGGIVFGGRCRIPHTRFACHNHTIGWPFKQVGDRIQNFGGWCGANEYIADMRGWTYRWDDDNVDEPVVEIMCCRNGS